MLRPNPAILSSLRGWRAIGASLLLGLTTSCSPSTPRSESWLPVEASLVPPTPAAPAPSLETRTIPLRFKRPMVNGKPGRDYALLRFLEESLSASGTLEYRAEHNTIVVTDRTSNLHSISILIDLLDFAGLPVPSHLRHLPFHLEDGARVVPNIPAGRY